MPSTRQDLIILLIILLVNAIVSVIYFIVSRIAGRKEDSQKNSSWVRLAIMLLIPVIGPVFFFVSWLLYRIFFSSPVDLEDVIFSKDRIKFHLKADEEKERNLVSMEEAVEITEKGDLRELMMKVVSGDIKKFLYAINLALNSDDSETAHYAASVLQDAINDFRMFVHKNYKEIKEDSEHKMTYAEALIEYMNPVLEQKILIEIEQKEFVRILDEVTALVFDNPDMEIKVESMESVAIRLIEIDDYEGCLKWCDRLKLRYPDALATYTVRLKLLFKEGKKEEFFELIDELKKSTVVIDNETLELIRVFQR